jgi:hypothetical protein
MSTARTQVCVSLGLLVLGTAVTGCGSDDPSDARLSSAIATTPATTTTDAAPATVTSWGEQAKLRYHFAKRPIVLFAAGSPDPAHNGQYIAFVRLNRRLHRIPKKDRDDPDLGGKDGPTRGTVLVNGIDGIGSGGVAAISFTTPCYQQDVDPSINGGPPKRFSYKEGQVAVVTLKVPKQPNIQINVRAYRETKARTSAALQTLGCSDE